MSHELRRSEDSKSGQLLRYGDVETCPVPLSASWLGRGFLPRLGLAGPRRHSQRPLINNRRLPNCRNGIGEESFGHDSVLPSPQSKPVFVSTNSLQLVRYAEAGKVLFGWSTPGDGSMTTEGPVTSVRPPREPGDPRGQT